MFRFPKCVTLTYFVCSLCWNMRFSQESLLFYLHASNSDAHLTTCLLFRACTAFNEILILLSGVYAVIGLVKRAIFCWSEETIKFEGNMDLFPVLCYRCTAYSLNSIVYVGFAFCMVLSLTGKAFFSHFTPSISRVKSSAPIWKKRRCDATDQSGRGPGISPIGRSCSPAQLPGSSGAAGTVANGDALQALQAIRMD